MSHKPKVAKLDGMAKLPHLTVLNLNRLFNDVTPAQLI